MKKKHTKRELKISNNDQSSLLGDFFLWFFFQKKNKYKIDHVSYPIFLRVKFDTCERGSSKGVKKRDGEKWLGGFPLFLFPLLFFVQTVLKTNKLNWMFKNAPCGAASCDPFLSLYPKIWPDATCEKQKNV